MAKAVARVASSVFWPGMTSRRGMTDTGLKKWNPTTRSGCCRSAAMSVIDRLDVFDASTHSGPTMASTSAKTCFFTDICSNTASMTKSASAKPSLLVEPVTRALYRLSLSPFSRPFLAIPSSWPCT